MCPDDRLTNGWVVQRVQCERLLQQLGHESVCLVVAILLRNTTSTRSVLLLECRLVALAI